MSKLTVHVPRGYEDERALEAAGGVMVCKVIVSHEKRLMCGKVFEKGRESAFQKHCGECALAHIDEIRKASPQTRMPFLAPDAWDPEVDEHMRRVGERMVSEGRLEVRPNERAGF